jgi:hypothetical protein
MGVEKSKILHKFQQFIEISATLPTISKGVVKLNIEYKLRS